MSKTSLIVISKNKIRFYRQNQNKKNYSNTFNELN